MSNGIKKAAGKDLIPLIEAAEYSGLAAEYLRQLAVKGRLEALKIGRNWVTTKSAVDKYLGDRDKRGRKPTKKNPLT